MASTDVLAVPHIGPQRHPWRNLFLIGSAIVVGLIAAVFTSRTADLDEPAVAELDQFRGAMRATCKDGRFAGPTSASLAKSYMASEALRRTVIEQYHALQRGQASCDDVKTALAKAGYPF